MKHTFILILLITPFFLNAQNQNTTLGTYSGQNLPASPVDITGNANTFVGFETGKYNTDGSENTFIGMQAGIANIDGSFNTFIGSYSGIYNNDDFNTFVGTGTGLYNEGDNNSFMGALSGHFNRGNNNTFFGSESGIHNKTGNNNTYIGRGAGSGDPFIESTGSNNAFLGYNSGSLNISGTQNTFIGTESGELNEDGNYNTFVGARSGEKSEADHNTFIGRASGILTTSGGFNTFLGSASGYRNTNGKENTYLGVSAGFENRGGDFNTFVGRSAGRLNRWGNYNTYIGHNAGYSNRGHGNVFIGTDAGYDETDLNETLIIHNSVSDTPLIYGDFATGELTINGFLDVTGQLRTNKTLVMAPDSQDQTDTEVIDNALSRINQINGVAYSDVAVSDKTANTNQIGFVAGNVEKVLPELVTKDENGNYYIDYNGFTPIIVEALKEQEKVINSQESLIEKQDTEITLQKEQISDLESRVKSLENLMSNLEAGDSNFRNEHKIEQGIVLKQNMPNPASKVTIIEYDIPQTLKAVSLNIYDISGKTLLSQPVTGKSSFSFDITTLAGGTYVYALVSNDQVIAKQKMIVKK